MINAAQTTVIQDAWDRGQALAIHGWVYGLKDGLARYLDITISNAEELARASETNWENEKDIARLENGDGSPGAIRS